MVCIILLLDWNIWLIIGFVVFCWVVCWWFLWCCLWWLVCFLLCKLNKKKNRLLLRSWLMVISELLLLRWMRMSWMKGWDSDCYWLLFCRCKKLRRWFVFDWMFKLLKMKKRKIYLVIVGIGCGLMEESLLKLMGLIKIRLFVCEFWLMVRNLRLMLRFKLMMKVKSLLKLRMFKLLLFVVMVVCLFLMVVKLKVFLCLDVWVFLKLVK